MTCDWSWYDDRVDLHRVDVRQRRVCIRDSLPDLRLLVATGMAKASMDIESAHRLGIVVSGTRGVVGPAAELAWALLLALVRNIPEEVAT